ncbi:MAG: replication-associated recombination protein A [Lentisphaerae bacterium]|nr:replication-associated recombination protein A [Lentisphaerota bacterium]
MDDFFDKSDSTAAGAPRPGGEAGLPLAARMRPACLDEVLGQEHMLGAGRLLRRVIEADRLTNLIFYGPPGCGKTSLAEVIARATRRRFERCSGVLSNVAALRNICETARLFRDERGTVLFIDEIHRFNKAQQDVLLPYVEDGTVTLIGATTHNPQVFINTPLTSRSLVFELHALDRAAVRELLTRALADPVRGLGAVRTEVREEALAFLAEVCDGDARRALTALEVAVRSTPPDAEGVVRIDGAVMADCVQRKMLAYDKDEDGHYDTISAFIKSLRGSDPHAAIYWLAKMLEAGEDPRFIARRLMIFASEDVGNADPRGLTIAVAAMQASEVVGMPEARLILAQATTYLATAPKSNASYLAIDGALADVRQGRTLAVPEHLKNRHVTAFDKEAPAAYQYPHDFEGHHVKQEYVPTTTRYYRPDGQGYEEVIRRRLEAWEAAHRNASQS